LRAWAVHLFPCSSSRLHSFAAPDHPISPAAWTRPSQTSEHTRTRTASSLSSSRDSGQTVSRSQSTQTPSVPWTPTYRLSSPETDGLLHCLIALFLTLLSFFLSLLPRKTRPSIRNTSSARNYPPQPWDTGHSIQPIPPRADRAQRYETLPAVAPVRIFWSHPILDAQESVPFLLTERWSSLKELTLRRLSLEPRTSPYHQFGHPRQVQIRGISSRSPLQAATQLGALPLLRPKSRERCRALLETGAKKEPNFRRRALRH
jgi:hypothetical protein